MNKYITLAIIITMALLQNACSVVGGQTKAAQFYVLSTDPGTSVARTTKKPVLLGLGPVTLPELFDRPQIVTRLDDNRVELSEYDRWGGDLNKDLVRVMSQNLMARLKTVYLAEYPWQHKERPDLQLAVQFFRFDGQLGKSARVAGVWKLLDGDSGCQLQVNGFDFEPVPGSNDYTSYVNALSAGLAQLSQEIAEQVASTKVDSCKE